MKICSKCKISKTLDGFYKHKASKDGLHSQCMDCHKADGRLRKQLKRKDSEFKQKELAYKKEYRAKNIDQHKQYMKQWHANNTEQQAAYRKDYRNTNPEYFKQYRLINKHKINAKTRKRQASKIQRTPKWLTENDFWMIEEAYHLARLRTKLFGFEWEVDHIIPMQGKLVSGLHTPYNLQVIPRAENRSKNNKCEV